MARGMVRTAMHHLKPPARKPAYISSVEDESGSRASPAAALLLLGGLQTEAHTEDDKRPRAKNSYQVPGHCY